MNLVKEIDFSDASIKGKLPIVIYSSIAKKPNREYIYLINIEPLNDTKKMDIEIFSNNFYKKGKIESFNSNLNIYSFRCKLEENYFIKIEIEEFNYDDDEKDHLLFYGFYKFEKNILEIDSINNVEENNKDIMSFMNGFNEKSQDKI